MGLEQEFAAKIPSSLSMGVNHGDSCGTITSTVLALGLTPDTVADRPKTEKPQEQPSPIIVGAGSEAARRKYAKGNLQRCRPPLVAN